jgi:hypothetical protein
MQTKKEAARMFPLHLHGAGLKLYNYTTKITVDMLMCHLLS